MGAWEVVQMKYLIKSLDNLLGGVGRGHVSLTQQLTIMFYICVQKCI